LALSLLFGLVSEHVYLLTKLFH